MALKLQLFFLIRIMPQPEMLQRDPQAAACLQAQINREVVEGRSETMAATSLLEMGILQSILVLGKDLEDQRKIVAFCLPVT